MERAAYPCRVTDSLHGGEPSALAADTSHRDDSGVMPGRIPRPGSTGHRLVLGRLNGDDQAQLHGRFRVTERRVVVGDLRRRAESGW